MSQFAVLVHMMTFDTTLGFYRDFIRDCIRFSRQATKTNTICYDFHKNVTSVFVLSVPNDRARAGRCERSARFDWSGSF